MRIIPLLLAVATTVAAKGYFTTPSGADGALTVKTGDTIDVAWTNISDYNILSLGYYSGSNETITWLISNSNSHPKSYRWTVDAVQKGFNLADSRSFRFYVCKDYDFGDPFISASFIINDPTSSSSSSTSSTTSAPSSPVSSTANIVTPTSATGTTFASTPARTAHSASNTASASPKSSKIGGGAVAGIVVGVIAGIALVATAAFLLYRKRQRLSSTTQGATAKHAFDVPSSTGATSAGGYHANKKTFATAWLSSQPAPIGQEVEGASPNNRHGHPVEMSSGGDHREKPVELP